MAAVTPSPTTVAPVQVPALAWLASIVAFATLYVVFSENGAVLVQSWETMHEFFHDGRHLFGVPCH